MFSMFSSFPGSLSGGISSHTGAANQYIQSAHLSQCRIDQILALIGKPDICLEGYGLDSLFPNPGRNLLGCFQI